MNLLCITIVSVLSFINHDGTAIAKVKSYRFFFLQDFVEIK